MTDKELVEKFCEECREFVSPFLLRQINTRGLYSIVNRLPSNVAKAKSVAYARMVKAGMVFNDPEIDWVAGTIKRMEVLRKELSAMNMADVHETIPVLNELKELSHQIENYYR